MSSFLVDKETAELEFENFCEDWEIDDDLSDLKEEDVSGFNTQKNCGRGQTSKDNR